jgi:hypothetical protein
MMGQMAGHYRKLQVINFEGVELYHFGPKKEAD